MRMVKIRTTFHLVTDLLGVKCDVPHDSCITRLTVRIFQVLVAAATHCIGVVGPDQLETPLKAVAVLGVIWFDTDWCVDWFVEKMVNGQIHDLGVVIARA